MMRVKTLIELLNQFDSEAEVRLSITLPGRITAETMNIGVGDYGEGPQLWAALDPRHFRLYFGCGGDQVITDTLAPAFGPTPRPSAVEHSDPVDLGQYADEELAAKVRDFYNFHRRNNVPLTYPDFDYANWIAPRMVSGSYNEHIAAILREKLLRE